VLGVLTAIVRLISHALSLQALLVLSGVYLWTYGFLLTPSNKMQGTQQP